MITVLVCPSSATRFRSRYNYEFVFNIFILWCVDIANEDGNRLNVYYERS